jgi:mono/diheme cytochrome c family protein
MRYIHLIALTALVSASLVVSAQQPAPGGAAGGRPTSPTASSGQGGRIGGAGIGAYPARAPGDPAAIERGRSIYSTNCAFCHGADTRGGASGPSLLRSAIVLDDKSGELIGPVVQAGRPDRGMPKFPMSDDQIADLAAFVHSFAVNGYDSSRQRPATIVVGNAAAGEAVFKAKCASCHSPTGDLQGFARRISNPRTLQQTWLMPGSTVGRGGGPMPAKARPPSVTVTLPSGQKFEGELERLDDFFVALRTADGGRRVFRTTDGTKVDVKDPLAAHRELLPTYSDPEIHNVTAFLVTLK